LRFDGSAITIRHMRYGPCTLLAVQSDDVHCFSTKMTPVQDDIYYVVDEKKTEERGKKKYLVNPYFNEVIKFEILL